MLVAAGASAADVNRAEVIDVPMGSLTGLMPAPLVHDLQTVLGAVGEFMGAGDAFTRSRYEWLGQSNTRYPGGTGQVVIENTDNIGTALGHWSLPS